VTSNHRINTDPHQLGSACRMRAGYAGLYLDDAEST